MTTLPRVVALSTAALLALPMLTAAPASAAPRAKDTTTGHEITRGVQPLSRAHAHNDYEHTRPLFDALSHGFTSVEADVWLVGDQLQIGHDAPDPTRTLQNTYLDKLEQVAAANKGNIYPGYTDRFRLYIDVKTEGKAAWPVIEKALAQYPGLVTTWKNNKRVNAPVEVVISGGRDLPAMEAANIRRSAFDGRLPDIVSGLDPQVMTVLSDNWTNNFTWKGEGEMPAAERRKLHRIVEVAHAQGYEVRFWATPDTAGAARDAVWRELIAADVDQLNTDDLAGLEAFLLAGDPEAKDGAPKSGKGSKANKDSKAKSNKDRGSSRR